MFNRNTVKAYFAGFDGLRTMGRQFWLMEAFILLNAFSFYTVAAMAVVYMKQDLGMVPEKAGLYWGWFITCYSVLPFLTGPLIDRIGFRKGLVLGASLCFMGFGGMAAMPFIGLGPPGILAALALAGIGEGFLMPMANAGTKKFAPSEERARSLAFTMLVIVLQVGSIGRGVFIQFARMANGGNAHILAVAAGCAGLVAIASLVFMKDDRTAVAPIPTTQQPRRPWREKMLALVLRPWRLIPSWMREKAFIKVMGLVLLLTGGRMAFSIQDPLLNPYYMEVMGNGVELGWLLSLNPFIVLVALLLGTPLIGKMTGYTRLIVGLSIVTVAVLVLAIPPRVVQQALGVTSITGAYYGMAVAQICLCSLGEILFQPAFRQVVMATVPEGSEATYSGGLSLTMWLTRAVPAMISGFLLARYCPTGVRQQIEAGGLAYSNSPEMMFIILGAVAATAPVFLFLARRWYAKA
ncbi:MAG: MFS transporter [Candidatus Gracilibacteria bacterium]